MQEHQGLFLRLEGTSDGIAGDGGERELRLFLPFYFFTFLLFTQFPISMGEVMDELSSSFGPYEISMCIGSAQLLLSAIALRVEEGAVAGAALCQAHVGIIGIEEILAALVVLDMEGTERAVQLLGCDAEFLRNLRRGEARNGIENVVAIERLRQKITHLILQLDDIITILSDTNHLFVNHIIETSDFRILFTDKFLLLFNLQTLLLQQVLLLLERSTENFFRMPDCLLIALALLHRNITARLANLWQHISRNPVLNFTAVGSLEPSTKA